MEGHRDLFLRLVGRVKMVEGLQIDQLVEMVKVAAGLQINHFVGRYMSSDPRLPS